jgi:urease beta subunit
MHPGEYFIEPGEIEANVDRLEATALVKNTGDRPIQVGSHYHFFEVNRALVFDRAAAYGMRLNIPAGTAVRFEPGEEKEIALVTFGGARRIFGHNGLVNGRLNDANLVSDML